MKSVSRHKFLLCFRPAVDTAMLEYKGSAGKLENEDMKLLLIKQSISENGSSRKSVACHARKGGKRSLSRVVRAVMFQSILSRRVRDTNDFGHKSAQSEHSHRLSVSEDEPSSNSHADNESGMPLHSSSSSHQTSTLQQKNCSQTLKQRRMEVGQSSKHKNGMFLVLISLTMTVLWGRLCAILFTLFWLYFLSRR